MLKINNELFIKKEIVLANDCHFPVNFETGFSISPTSCIEILPEAVSIIIINFDPAKMIEFPQLIVGQMMEFSF